MSASVVDQLENSDPQGVHFVPGGASYPASAIFLHATDDIGGESVAIGAARGMESDENLVEDHFVEDLNARMRREPIRHSPRQLAAPFDHRGDAAATKAPERGVHGESTGAPRGFRDPVGAVASDSV